MVARLQRFKLGWLGWLVVLPRLTDDAFSTARHAWQGAAPASAQAATRRLAELTGKDLASAGQDVPWMVDQLGLLGARAADWPSPEPDPSHRVITRAELEMAAEALIGLVLNDRRTDDPPLAAAQGSYAVLARLQRERVERAVQRSLPRMLRGSGRRLPPDQGGKSSDDSRAVAGYTIAVKWRMMQDASVARNRIGRPGRLTE